LGLQPRQEKDYFAQLAPFFVLPLADKNVWTATGAFSPGANAPNARRQDLEKLTDTIVRWAKFPPEWLSAAA